MGRDLNRLRRFRQDVAAADPDAAGRKADDLDVTEADALVDGGAADAEEFCGLGDGEVVLG